MSVAFVRCLGCFYMIKKSVLFGSAFLGAFRRLLSIHISYFWLHRYYISYFWLCQYNFESFFSYFWLFFSVHKTILFCTHAGGLCVCLACVLCALFRLCGCDRLPSVSVVPSVCAVGSAAVPPGTPTRGGDRATPGTPFLNLLSNENNKNEDFYQKYLDNQKYLWYNELTKPEMR